MYRDLQASPWNDPTYLEQVRDELIYASSQINVVVIVNSVNDPDADSRESQWMNELYAMREAFRDSHTDSYLIGYVSTDNGERDIDEVKDEVKKYRRSLIRGIFFDKVPTNANDTLLIYY